MRSKPFGTPAQKKPVASMARGTTRKPKDNLSLDAMDARAAGMTYGKWKAQHPHTKEANEPRLAQTKKQPQERQVYEFTCRRCGERFTTNNKSRRYCGDGCKAKMDDARYRSKRSTKKETEGLQ